MICSMNKYIKLPYSIQYLAYYDGFFYFLSFKMEPTQIMPSPGPAPG